MAKKRTPKRIACGTCGKRLKNPRARFCSIVCKNSHHNARRRRVTVSGNGKQVCQQCGKSFKATRRHATYCSSGCRVVAYRARQQTGRPTPAAKPQRVEPIPAQNAYVDWGYVGNGRWAWVVISCGFYSAEGFGDPVMRQGCVLAEGVARGEDAAKKASRDAAIAIDPTFARCVPHRRWEDTVRHLRELDAKLKQRQEQEAKESQRKDERARKEQARKEWKPRSRRIDPQHLELLGVSADATDTELKAAFRRLALTTHPDHGGDAGAFKAAKAAMSAVSRARLPWTDADLEIDEIFDRFKADLDSIFDR
jgi:hypothetical protein